MRLCNASKHTIVKQFGSIIFVFCASIHLLGRIRRLLTHSLHLLTELVEVTSLPRHQRRCLAANRVTTQMNETSVAGHHEKGANIFPFFLKRIGSSH
ncbi:hypothetical protein DEM26_19190 [Thioclava sp. NG1]|nr:hypothetical protein DEM26_19190 [Thioclava sp. NG1]